MEIFKIIPSEIEGKKDVSVEIGKGFGDAMDILKELKCKGMVRKKVRLSQIAISTDFRTKLSAYRTLS